MSRLFIALSLLSLLSLLAVLVACQSSDDSANASSAEPSKHAQQLVYYTESIMSESASASSRASAVRWFASTIPADPAVRQRLRDLLTDDPDVTVRRAAAGTLGSPGYEEACGDLRRSIRRDDDLHVRLAAINSLGRHRDPADLSLWREILDARDASGQEQGAALAALAQLGTRDAGRAICDRLARSGSSIGPVDRHCLDALATMSPDVVFDEMLRVMERKRFTVSAINAVRLREQHGEASMARLVEVYRHCEQSRANGFLLAGDTFIDF